jgi:hypothetical protein
LIRIRFEQTSDNRRHHQKPCSNHSFLH